MYHVGNLALILCTIPWWICVVWYGLRLRHVRRTANSWNLLATALIVALVTSEELVMQRLMGGWDGHPAFIAVIVVAAACVGAHRVGMLWDTRPSQYANEERDHEAR